MLRKLWTHHWEERLSLQSNTIRNITGFGKKLLRLNGIIVALILLIVIVSLGSSKFYTLTNIMNVLRQASVLGVMACLGIFVIISGHIDLSAGSILSLCALISCNLTKANTSLAILVPLLVGAACGIFNGLLTGVLKFNPFIATLGTLSIFQAIAFFYCDGRFLNAASNESFRKIGQGFLAIIPIPVLILLGVFLIILFVLNKTTFGRSVYIVGGNPICAKFSGLSYKKATMLSYMLAGFGAAIGSILLVSRSMAAQPQMGLGYEFDVITALVVGGVSLSGGKGVVWYALLGVLFIGILKNSFILLGIPLYYQYSVMGIILILAVGLDVSSERRLQIG